MEISGKIPLADLNSGLQRLDGSQPTPKSLKPGDESPVHASDRIELSVQSREIQHLHELIQATPDSRDYKVEQLRSAIQNGTYNVRAEKIADKILGGNLIDEIF